MKYTKSLIVAIIWLSMLLMYSSTAAAQPSADIVSVSDGAGITGQYKIIQVNIANTSNAPIMAIKLRTDYNATVINLTSITAGTLTSTWEQVKLGTDKHTMTLATSDTAKAIPIASSGSIVLLNFSVVGPGGSTSTINLSLVELADPDGNLGTSPSRNGTFIVPIKGDVDGYAGITMADAMYIGKAVLNKPEFTLVTTTMDVDGLAGVTLNDALYLAKYVIGVPGFETLH